MLIQVVLTLVGFDHHDLPDSTFDHPDQLGMFSVRTVTGFFFGFGWTGVIALKAGFGLAAALAFAVTVGAAFLFGLYGLMRALYSLRSSGTLDYRNAIGQVATVYVTVPPTFQGGGQVEVLIQGRLQTISCRTAHTSPLAPQAKVKVIALIDQGTLEVIPL